jgi:hypothetical protein
MNRSSTSQISDGSDGLAPGENPCHPEPVGDGLTDMITGANLADAFAKVTSSFRESAAASTFTVCFPAGITRQGCQRGRRERSESRPAR